MVMDIIALVCWARALTAYLYHKKFPTLREEGTDQFTEFRTPVSHSEHYE